LGYLLIPGLTSMPSGSQSRYRTKFTNERGKEGLGHGGGGQSLFICLQSEKGLSTRHQPRSGKQKQKVQKKTKGIENPAKAVQL